MMSFVSIKWREKTRCLTAERRRHRHLRSLTAEIPRDSEGGRAVEAVPASNQTVVFFSVFFYLSRAGLGKCSVFSSINGRVLTRFKKENVSAHHPNHRMKQPSVWNAACENRKYEKRN
jgi:hypothetical protein